MRECWLLPRWSLAEGVIFRLVALAGVSLVWRVSTSFEQPPILPRGISAIRMRLDGFHSSHLSASQRSSARQTDGRVTNPSEGAKKAP